jgi:hypothetical protein
MAHITMKSRSTKYVGHSRGELDEIHPRFVEEYIWTTGYILHTHHIKLKNVTHIGGNEKLGIGAWGMALHSGIEQKICMGFC